MTPFGRRLRELRAQRNVTLKEMAAELGVSAAYLSALEHGKRGVPAWYLVQRVIAYFNVIWDEAEELERLAQISHPRIVLDMSGMPPEALEFAHLLARSVKSLKAADFRSLQSALQNIIEPRVR